MFLLLFCSGRVRQNGSSGGVATVRILVDGVELKEIGNPRPSLPSWQWISFTFNQQPEYNLTVMLTVEGFSATTAYFDDLCVTFDLPDEEGACFFFAVIISLSLCAFASIVDCTSVARFNLCMILPHYASSTWYSCQQILDGHWTKLKGFWVIILLSSNQNKIVCSLHNNIRISIHVVCFSIQPHPTATLDYMHNNYKKMF